MTVIDAPATGPDWSSAASNANRRRRYAADRRLRIYGLTAIIIAVGVLVILLATVLTGGASAFVQTRVTVEFTIDPELVSADNIQRGNYRQIITNAVAELFPEIADDRTALTAAGRILTSNAQFFVRDAVVADPSLIGRTLTLAIPASDPFDQLNKGTIARDLPEEQRRVNDRDTALFDQLVDRGLVSTPFNWGLFFNADSRFPELAGLRGAIIGSFYLLLVTLLVSVPVGIAAAIYLEEFARRGRWSRLIEVNINNLAAVPSVVFGLLGLAVFINFFGLPRSAPLVGGLVLSLMTLPTIIIVTRAALKAVPPSIREAAYGIGASKHQMVLHHVLPLALPGILTGTIIGMAQALGETAPLLLVGMNAFLTAAPGGITDAATALPTQIYIWADSSERGFVAKTSAGIVVLLLFLIVMNAVAIFLRRRLERTW
ncbi:MAG: phosphate ABC transporter permease PstA [Bauldia sp.]|nr:phosphate ABC transporter permease PstA [Bauldia sp.]MCW5717393.1 phosphate ABC transporter permease PstA [Bauldia sp.]